MMHRITAAVLAAALSLPPLGCASPTATLRTSYAVARTVYDAAVDQYRDEQEACLAAPPPPDPCVAAVRARWAPVRRAADALRAALLALAASLGAYDVLSRVGRTPDPAAVQRAAGRVLKAAVTLSETLAALGAP